MNAGELIHRVTIQTRTTVGEGDGFTESWDSARTRIAARILPLAGRDLEQARQIDPRASHTVSLRFWQNYPTDLAGGRARLIWHDGNVGDRTLEIVEPPREVEHRVQLAMIVKEQQ